MTATYSQLGTIGQQPDYQQRVAVGMNSAAVAIYNEVMATNAPTAAGNAVLHFAATPSVATVGAPVFDVTNSGVIPIGTTVISVTATTVTMSANAVGNGVVTGDMIAFVSGHVARAAFATKVLNGNYNLPAVCLAVLVNSTIQGKADPNVVGNAVPDPDIQFQINQIWSALAGA